MNEVVDLIGELSAGVSFTGEISVAPGHGPAIRIRAALPAKWPAEYPRRTVANFAHSEGERRISRIPLHCGHPPTDRRERV